MNNLSEKIIQELSQRSKYVVKVVEIYPRNTEDIVSLTAPANAIGRFSTMCYTWQNSEATHVYDAKVKSFPEVSSYLDDRINTAEVTFSNVKRGEGSMARFVLNNSIKGCWMVIRLLFPDHPNESHVVFWGKCQRPGGINTKELSITATQDLGNFKQKIPFREYQTLCPLEFARPFGGCLGDQTLAEKSVSYQQAVAQYGTAGCNKLFSTCTLFDNTRYFQGQRIVAVSGQFTYVTVEEVVKRFLFWTKKKKVSKTNIENYSSVNQSDDNETIPIAFGRCQIQGHPFSWADLGEQVKSLQGFCEGRISGFAFIRSRTEGIAIVSTVEHLGDWGGVGTQQADTLFNGASGLNSRLAYLELITDGSTPTQVDNAPIITAVIRGLEIPVPDVDGNYTVTEWTNNPVHITRFILTDLRFGRIPSIRMDDAENLITAFDCDEIVEDRTNEESIVLPANEADNYGITYQRLRSAGRWSALNEKIRTELPFGDMVADGLQPEFEEAEITWFDPFQPLVLPPSRSVLKQKYTCNGALQEKIPIIDFLNDTILPTFMGYINYGSNGKIQIKNRRRADYAYIRDNIQSGVVNVPITNIKAWRRDTSAYLLVGVSLETAEIREVTTYQYSTACNGTPITATSIGGMVITTSDIDGGTEAAPGQGYIDLSGTPSAGDIVELTIGAGDDAFTISYIADGIEDTIVFGRMLLAFMNANVQFASYLTAYILPDNPTRINVRCESGYLVLNKALEYNHSRGEEVLRVQAVFENCNELTANQSAQFDNIISDTFAWNEDEEDEINAISAKYTSAVDDFHITMLMPRAAWDTIDLEGELSKEEIDLTFVDNYWQAAYLAKNRAIDRIDGNLHFSFKTGILGSRLELGDVIAVRHDSGDGALNYVPVWVKTVELNLDDFTVKIGAKLYLTAAFDYHVQPIEPLLTTTLNAALYPDSPPPTIGSGGGQGTGSDPIILRPGHDYYRQFSGLGRYSPTGVDIV